MAPCWLYGGYVFPVVVKPENLTFQSNLALKVKFNSLTKQQGSWSRYFIPLVQIWWSYFEWAMSYGVDKLKMGQILTLKLNLTLKGKVDYPQNKRDVNQGVLHLKFKFGELSSNGWVIVRTNLVTDGRTGGRTQATTIPGGQKLTSGNKERNDPIITIKASPFFSAGL